MSLPRLCGLLVVLAFSSHACADDPQRMLAEHLRYLDLLTRVEAQLEAGQPGAALSELKQALACDVRDSYVPQIGLRTRGAVAHYLSACAYAMQNDKPSALESLRAAADNGFRNVELVKTDVRLNNVRKQAEFQRILKSFPAEPLTDRFAGKTVADREFGMGLLRHRSGNFPKLGETAPDFELGLVGQQQGTLRLSDFRGKMPVVLIFGSFT